jgi:protein TonB
MLAYAAANPHPAGRAGSLRALVLILAGHAVLIGAVMTAKMGVIHVDSFDPIDVVNIPIKPPPPPEPQPTKPAPQPSFIERPVTSIDMPAIRPTLPIKPVPVRIAAVFATPENALRPPYPASKIRLEQEATLRLRLSIDTRGRVTAVEPVGAADPEFLAAARRHIIRSWRYKPATEDGVAVPTSIVISLAFRLEDA